MAEMVIASLPFQFQPVVVNYVPGQRGLDEHYDLHRYDRAYRRGEDVISRRSPGLPGAQTSS